MDAVSYGASLEIKTHRAKEGDGKHVKDFIIRQSGHLVLIRFAREGIHLRRVRLCDTSERRTMIFTEICANDVSDITSLTRAKKSATHRETRPLLTLVGHRSYVRVSVVPSGTLHTVERHPDPDLRFSTGDFATRSVENFDGRAKRIGGTPQI